MKDNLRAYFVKLNLDQPSAYAIAVLYEILCHDTHLVITD